MKRQVLTLNSALVFVWVLVVICIFLCTIRSPTMYQSRKDVSIVKVNNYLYKEEDCSDTEVEKIKETLGYLPKSFLKDFKDKGGKIILVSDLKGDCVGSTEINKDSIVVYIEDGYVFNSLIHEFGHVYLHFNPMEEDFKEIYEAEAKSLVEAYYGVGESYAYSNEVEYFAQAFQTVLCMGGHDTQNAAPKTFSYMTDLITEMFKRKI